MRLARLVLRTLTLIALSATAADAAEIHTAVTKGDLAEVRRILAAHPDQVGAKDQAGRTPLYLAARGGQSAIVGALLEQGADVAATTPSGFTPLFAAVQGRHAEIVSLLLASKADVNAVSKYGTTALFLAAEADDAALVQTLVERGAKLDHVSPMFGAALHRAAYMDAPSAAERLLASGASVSLRDGRGLTALGQAAMLGSASVARLCLARGAEVDAADASKRTPLLMAVLWGTARRTMASRSAELAALLLGHGARADHVAADGTTPLLAAVQRGYTNIATMLIDRGAPVTVRQPGTERTLLHLAALHGFGDVVDLLVARRVDIDARDASGATALAYALAHGHATVAARLGTDPKTVSMVNLASQALRDPMTDHDAAVWRLDNRGWAVRTGTHLFVFDNEEQGRRPDLPSLSNGWILASEISPFDVLALYSAYHAQPNTMEFIHALEPVLPRVAYVNYKDDVWRGGSKTVYIGGRENQRFGSVEVLPYETRDSGGMGSLGFLVRSSGLTLFYPNFFPEDIGAFKKEIDALAQQSTRCDLAFIETASEQPAAYAAYIIERLKPRVVIPFDRGGNLAAAEALATELRAKYPTLQVALTRDPGDRLDYVGGRLVSTAPVSPTRR